MTGIVEMYSMRLKTEYRTFAKYGMISAAVVLILYFMNFLPPVQNPFSDFEIVGGKRTCDTHEYAHVKAAKRCKYRVKYPLSNPKKVTYGVSYRIAIISDLDEERSKDGKYQWKSYLRYGHLVKYDSGKYVIDWNDDIIKMTSKMNEKGRGFELSELCAFNEKLYTVDDRTGIIYQIANNKAIPWVILQDGDGMDQKGFKGEWMTVKDGALYVGGLGKEWTTKDGEFVNYHPLFVKSISPHGAVVHHNWTEHYLKIRAKAGIHFPGYMIHEAVSWSNAKRRWYFLPRRMSTLKYNEEDDERRGTNVLISCGENFEDLHMVRVGQLHTTRGFSSFKFVPGTGDNVAVALKSEEVNKVIRSYIMVFHVETGNVLMTETLIEDQKYEGVEFV